MEGVVGLLRKMKNAKEGRVRDNVVPTAEARRVEELFKALGRMSWESFVQHRLPLLFLPEDLKAALEEGAIPYTAALELKKVKDEASRKVLLEEARAGLSLRELRARVREVLRKEKAPRPWYREVGERLLRLDLEALPPERRALEERKLKELEELLGRARVDRTLAALAVRLRLLADIVAARPVEAVGHDRVARAVLVDVGRAVPDPLTRHEDRQLHVILDFAHLKRRAVPVAHQITDQAAILIRRARAAAIGNARSLHNGGVIAHVIDHPDKAVIQHGKRLEQHGFQRGHGWAARRRLASARGFDFLLLCFGQCHGEIRPF